MHMVSRNSAHTMLNGNTRPPTAHTCTATHALASAPRSMPGGDDALLVVLAGSGYIIALTAWVWLSFANNCRGSTCACKNMDVCSIANLSSRGQQVAITRAHSEGRRGWVEVAEVISTSNRAYTTL